MASWNWRVGDSWRSHWTTTRAPSPRDFQISPLNAHSIAHIDSSGDGMVGASYFRSPHWGPQSLHLEESSTLYSFIGSKGKILSRNHLKHNYNFEYALVYSENNSSCLQRPRALSSPGQSQSLNRTQRKCLQCRTSKLPSKPSVPYRVREEARFTGIPGGYSIKNWDPSEEPIILLDGQTMANWFGTDSLTRCSHEDIHLHSIPEPIGLRMSTIHDKRYAQKHSNERRAKATKSSNLSQRQAPDHIPKLDCQGKMELPKNSPKLDVHDSEAHYYKRVDVFGRRNLAVWKHGAGRSKEWRRSTPTKNSTNTHARYKVERKNFGSKDLQYVETDLPCALLKRNPHLKTKPGGSSPRENRTSRKGKKENLQHAWKSDPFHEDLEALSNESYVKFHPLCTQLT